MELASILETDEFKKALHKVVREQLDQSYQDMEEIRRSPGAAIIRIEEEIKSMKQQISTIEQNMVTKEEFKSKFMELEGRFEGKFEGIEGRFKGLEGKINLITGLIFVMLTLYGALVVKFIFFP